MGKATTNSLDKVFKSKDISLPMKTLIFTFFFFLPWGPIVGECFPGENRTVDKLYVVL